MSELPASAEPKPRKRLSGWWYVAAAVALLVGLGLAVLQPVQQIYAIKFLKAEGASLNRDSESPITILGLDIPLAHAPINCFLPRAGSGSMKIGSRTAAAAWWAEHESLRHDLMSAVSKLPKLTYLSLGRMPVSGEDLQLLRKLPNLETLWLETVSSDSSELAVLQELPNLSSLSLHSSNATDATLVHIIGLDQIIALNLSDTAITDAGIHELRQMPRLQILALVGTDLTDKGVLELQHFPSLRRVLIRQNHLVHAKAVEELLTATPGLEVADEDW